MSFEGKIALFWLGVFLVMGVVRASPGSILSRFALAWIGPVREEAELRSRYLRRQAVFALGWLAQFLVVAALLVLLCDVFPSLMKSDAFVIVTGFALTIGIGMALLGALLAWLGSIKAVLLGPDPVWRAPASPIADDELEPSGFE